MKMIITDNYVKFDAKHEKMMISFFPTHIALVPAGIAKDIMK